MENINNILITDMVNGKEEEKMIHELPREELKYYKSLGKAICLDLYHGLFLGSKHEKNFWQRVYGYAILKNNKEARMISKAIGNEYMAIEFYEQNIIEDLEEDDDIGLIYYLYEGEQLKEKLGEKALKKIKEYEKSL